jgi:hypothetical protein
MIMNYVYLFLEEMIEKRWVQALGDQRDKGGTKLVKIIPSCFRMRN